ncbi:MAG: hypothetical protein R3B54_04870 [Bdellovibrionota bacterium]
MKHVNNSSAKWALWSVEVAFAVTMILPGSIVLGADSYYGGPSASKVSAATDFGSKLGGKLSKASEGDQRPKTVEEAKKQLADVIGRLKITEDQKKQALEFFNGVADINRLNQALVQLRQQELDDAKKAKDENDALEKKAQSMSSPPVATNNLDTGRLPQECGKSQVEGHLSGWSTIMQAVGDFSKFTRDALKGIAKEDKKAREEALDKAIAKAKKEILESIKADDKSDDYEEKLDKGLKATKGGNPVPFAKYIPKAIEWMEAVKKKKSLALLDNFFNSVAGKRDANDKADKINESARQLKEAADKYVVAAEAPVSQSVSTLAAKCEDFKFTVLGGNQQPGQNSLRGKQKEAMDRFQTAFEAQGPAAPGGQVVPAQQDRNFLTAASNFASSLVRKGRQLIQGVDCQASARQQVASQMATLRSQAATLEGVTDPDSMIRIAAEVMQNFGNTFQSVNGLVNTSAAACTAWSQEAKRLDTNVKDLDKQIAQARQQSVGPQAPGLSRFRPRFLTALRFTSPESFFS